MKKIILSLCSLLVCATGLFAQINRTTMQKDNREIIILSQDKSLTKNEKDSLVDEVHRHKRQGKQVCVLHHTLMADFELEDAVHATPIYPITSLLQDVRRMLKGMNQKHPIVYYGYQSLLHEKRMVDVVDMISHMYEQIMQTGPHVRARLGFPLQRLKEQIKELKMMCRNDEISWNDALNVWSSQLYHNRLYVVSEWTKICKDIARLHKIYVSCLINQSVRFYDRIYVVIPTTDWCYSNTTLYYRYAFDAAQQQGFKKVQASIPVAQVSRALGYGVALATTAALHAKNYKTAAACGLFATVASLVTYVLSVRAEAENIVNAEDKNILADPKSSLWNYLGFKAHQGSFVDSKGKQHLGFEYTIVADDYESDTGDNEERE